MVIRKGPQSHIIRGAKPSCNARASRSDSTSCLLLVCRSRSRSRTPPRRRRRPTQWDVLPEGGVVPNLAAVPPSQVRQTQHQLPHHACSSIVGLPQGRCSGCARAAFACLAITPIFETLLWTVETCLKYSSATAAAARVLRSCFP
jgi:hypothetical protein